MIDKKTNGVGAAGILWSCAMAFVIFVHVIGWMARARAQDERAQEGAAVTTIARALIAEATWSEIDHRGILFRLARWADVAEIPIDEMARRYVSGLRSGARESRRLAWVLSIGPECDEPASWPASYGRWERYRAKCAAVFKLTRDFLDGAPIEDPCHGLADHWGAPTGSDLERAKRAQFVRVDCGPTANAFWALPSRQHKDRKK